jgi:release factor glutamine methyltransferase
MSEIREPEMMTIAAAMAESSRLASDSASLDVELLLCHVLECDRVYLRTWPDRALNAAQAQFFLALLEKRIKGQPIAYLIGSRDFWSLNLAVNEHTLIPRPDTEVLVERVLELDLGAQASVLDLGTGTGAIALALASERPLWKVVGVDCFDAVVSLAKENAHRNNILNAVFFKSDWFAAIGDSKFNLILSNPPYIDANDPHLSQGDVCYEPSSALVSGENGLEDIAIITRTAPRFLEDDAWLVFEHGYQQGAEVRRLLLQAGYRAIHTYQDYGSNDRVTLGQRPV